ncbi:hypothetical protein DCC81_02665 [Chitinophaga parva]|uniref:Uncharacterized protein n=1 Tax=Chitinophaga parva TaxID=2169414 RepID=A0A2T7BL55_9BACT|nr:hypothetical protein DCC81_02665 [Chitinophaga parva]
MFHVEHLLFKDEEGGCGLKNLVFCWIRQSHHLTTQIFIQDDPSVYLWRGYPVMAPFRIRCYLKIAGAVTP